ncbi:MAG: regulatory iron-sulfur-containing complex subunit RicT [Kiritimatiellae bacterium]|nr:regulatory iron-sulfur-containing complex subunit RicT [Kiritimatiellia bacterium]
MQPVARIKMPEKGIFNCRLPDALALLPGDRCIVELDYGLDNGVVLEIIGFHENGDAAEKIPGFRVVRKLDCGNDARLKDNAGLADKARNAFMLSVSTEKTHVKILHTRFSYGRERLFIRYAAAVPVDLRRFVAQLQRDYKTRVDLWQVGVRDEAALVGCLGPCGRAVCCCTWQQQFSGANVHMARVQDMSLNPITLNGSCGRLKCCIKFEYEQYRELESALPGLGSVVRLNEPEMIDARVVGRDIMRGMLTVRSEDGRFFTVKACETNVVRKVEAHSHKEVADEDSDDEWSQPEAAGHPRAGDLRE